MKQTRRDIDATLASCPSDTILLLQNEINEIDYLIAEGARRGFRVCLNPAPFSPAVPSLPLDSVDILVVNETEAEGLVGTMGEEETVDALVRMLPDCEIVMTIGPEGLLYGKGDQRIRRPAEHAVVVDTTAAGDTFIGYFLAARAEGRQADDALYFASIASALCVAKPGACDAIPARADVEARLSA
jgi:ribokinase